MVELCAIRKLYILEMCKMKKFIDFLERLEKHKIYYTLDKTREDYIRVDITVPGER